MKRINIFTTGLIALYSLLVSCTKNFEEINTDPNRIDKISPGTLLNPILYEVSAFNMQRANDITFGLMQVSLPYPSVSGGIHRYDVTENTGNSTWNAYYRWLKNVKEMNEASVAAGDVTYQAISMTLNAWIYSNLTDCFGDVPMEEAGRGDEGLYRPKFNTQQEIYNRLIGDLDSANKLFSANKAMIYGTDIMYANNVANWRRFCNSLQMRLLLRVSKRAEMDSWNKLRIIIDNPTTYPVFTANTEAAVLKLTGITPLVSPWGRAIDFTTFRAASSFFIDNLMALNDPRLAKFATAAKDLSGASIGYKGIPSGYGNEASFNYTPSNLSIALVTAPMSNYIMPYAEVEFIKAEVEQRTGNTAAAKAAYEKGVKAAIEQWSLTVPANYLTSGPGAYDGTLERILLQKYFALFFVDYQQWFEYRRTGLPVLPVSSGMMNGGKMPVRFRYPISIQTNNIENYKAAVAALGEDNINTKLWWEK